MQLPTALQSPISFHLGCGYARNKSKKNKQVLKFDFEGVTSYGRLYMEWNDGMENGMEQ